MDSKKKTIKIAEYQDVYEAQMVKSFLAENGIASYLPGFFHRHLLYFFGPFIEMILYTSVGDQKMAEQLIKEYLVPYEA